MIAGALLVIALLGPAAAEITVLHPAAVSGAEDTIILVQDSAEELGFVDEYFPLSLSEDLHPSTDKLIVPFFLAYIFLPFGWLWSPWLFADEKPGSGYLLDVFLIMLFHALLSGCATLLALIPVVGCLLLIPILIFNVVNLEYLAPIALLNAYDRSIKSGGSSDGAPKLENDEEEEEAPSERKKRQRPPPREEALLGTPPAVVMSF